MNRKRRASQISISIIMIFFLGCGADQGGEFRYRRVQAGDVRAEGKMSSDTVYDGLIRFYNVRTKKLLEQCYYKEGVLEGQAESFFGNGKLQSIQNYSGGKRNGIFRHYDSLGNLLKEENFYYGLRQGSVVIYKENKPREYVFLSLEERPLLSLNYQNLENKRIADVVEDFFFFGVNNFFEIKGDSAYEKKEYLLYLPNPPKYNFRYSLVIIDSTFQVLEVLKEFDQRDGWAHFDLSKTDYNSKPIALELKIDDPVSGEVLIFKKLKTDL